MNQAREDKIRSRLGPRGGLGDPLELDLRLKGWHWGVGESMGEESLGWTPVS